MQEVIEVENDLPIIIVKIACHYAVLMQYLLLAESSRVLTRTLNLLFTVTLVLSMRVTLPPSFTMYTSGSKNTPATAHKGRGPSSEVSRKVVACNQRRASSHSTDGTHLM